MADKTVKQDHLRRRPRAAGAGRQDRASLSDAGAGERRPRRAGQMVGMARRDLYILADERPFWMNFLKGIAGMWCYLHARAGHRGRAAAPTCRG